MPRHDNTTTQPNWYLILGLTIVVAVIFFLPYLGIIVVSAIMAYCFLRPYRWLARRMPERYASIVTMFLSIAVVVVPLSLILIVAVVQGLSIVNDLSSSVTERETSQLVSGVNTALEGFNNGQPVVSPTSFHEFIVKTIPEIVNFFLSAITNIAGTTTALMTHSIIYGFLVCALLVKHADIRRAIKILSPFDDNTSEAYIVRAGSIITGSLQGQLLIAFILGVSNALLMFMIGLGEYFFFFVIIYTLLSLVPLGTGIVIMPLGIIAMLTGHVWEGFWMLFMYLVVVCNMDNFLRPRLIPKNARISPALLTISTFSGLYYFGLLGIVYGPFIAIMLVMTLETYLDYRKRASPLPQQERAS